MSIGKMLTIFLIALAICEQGETITSSQIVAHAESYIDQTGWSCKEFINQVIGDLGGSVGSANALGYRECYLQSGFNEVSSPQPGDVIQTSNPDINHMWDDRDLNNDGKSDFIYHSAFVFGSVQDDPASFWVIDANYSNPPDNKVRKHIWQPYNYVANKPGHRVYFYRLGDVIARFSDGAIHQPILDCYNQFSSLAGQPFDNGGGVFVHQWYSRDGLACVEIQDFFNSATGEYFAIVSNPRLSFARRG